MAKTFGDEEGILWSKPVYIGRSASKDTLRGTKLPDPADYTPPEYRSILSCPRIALDIETHDPKLEEKGPGVYRQDGFTIGVAIDYGDGDRRYYPLRHSTGTNLNPTEFLLSLKREAAQFTGTLVNANLQYDLDWLGAEGVFFTQCKFFDVQYAEPLLNENRPSYRLDVLGQHYLGEGKFKSRLEQHYGDDFIKHMKDIHPAYVGEYACGDVYLPLGIMDKQIPLLEAEGLTNLCEMEHGLLPLLLQMRRTGVRVDTAAAQSAKTMCEGESSDIQKQLKQLTGFDVEVYSADSIAQAYDAIGIQYPRTARGAPSFRKEWLRAQSDPLSKLITGKRNVDKFSGTFLNNFILEGQVNGRIHCLFHPLRGEEGGAVSGRFSSSNPNLQQIPVRDKRLGPMCRKMFIPEEDHLWGCVDWSQIEFRFLVHYAVQAKCKGAEVTAQMYKDDPKTDFHTAAAKIAYGENYKTMRDPAKSINFGVVYGLGKAGMAANLGCSIEEAEPKLAEFHTRMPWLKPIFNLAVAQAEKKGYITTILGRRQRFDMWEKGRYDSEKLLITTQQYNEMDPRERRGFRRYRTHKALNALLQGSAADLMKKAMLLCYQKGVFSVLKPHLTVHDEMDVSIPKTSEGQEAFKELIHTMENALPLNVPVIASANTGANWYEAK